MKVELLEKLLEKYGSEARIRVDTQYGYVSYGRHDLEKAIEAYASGGIRLKVQKNIFDDGTTVLGNLMTNEVVRGNC